MICGRLATASIVGSGLLLSSDLGVRCETRADVASFAHCLSSQLLGGPEFVALPGGSGWRGVLLAQPGTSISPLTEAYNGLAGSLSQSLANASVFDRVVQASGGYAVLGTRRLDFVWKDLLDSARPNEPLTRDRMLQTAVMKWLFKPIYRGRRVSGYTREPSRFVTRYNFFQDTYEQLVRGKESGMWRLDSRLKSFATFEEAQRAISAEWLKSGYKAEVESARWSFETAISGAKWVTWSVASHAFAAHMIPIALYDKLPETYLIPPPASWSSVANWVRVVCKDTDGRSDHAFQLARIAIARPWIDVEPLVSGKLRLYNKTLVSDGTTPTMDKLPSGDLPAFVEDILLTRFIEARPRKEPAHPLDVYAYPDSINLIGFIVRVLPQVEN